MSPRTRRCASGGSRKAFKRSSPVASDSKATATSVRRGTSSATTCTMRTEGGAGLKRSFLRRQVGNAYPRPRSQDERLPRSPSPVGRRSRKPLGYPSQVQILPWALPPWTQCQFPHIARQGTTYTSWRLLPSCPPPHGRALSLTDEAGYGGPATRGSRRCIRRRPISGGSSHGSGFRHIYANGIVLPRRRAPATDGLTPALLDHANVGRSMGNSIRRIRIPCELHGRLAYDCAPSCGADRDRHGESSARAASPSGDWRTAFHAISPELRCERTRAGSGSLCLAPSRVPSD